MTKSQPSKTDSPNSEHVNRLINSNYYVSPSKPIFSDRFIPCRTTSNRSLFNVKNDRGSTAYAAVLSEALFGTPTANNIFRYKTETKQPMETLRVEDASSALRVDDASSAFRVRKRKVSASPFKVLDAPDLKDDFYMNVLDWSSQNVLLIGLGNCVYLWNASNCLTTMLCELKNGDCVSSVGWAKSGTQLAVGTYNGEVQIWDPSQCKKVRVMGGHGSRVGSVAWSSSLLSSGSRDKSILHRDIRVQDDFVSKLSGHTSEICGLKWSFDNRELASGGNDNKLLVWNQHSTRPVLQSSQHKAAVKAIAWSPHHYGLLASGGGTTDRCIRFWNTSFNSHLKCVDTGSQVCNLVWSKTVNELVSTHGFSKNEISVWNYPCMSKLATLTGHTCRVLYLAISPDGQNIVTGAGDETLRFWNVFPCRKSKITDTEFGALSRGTSIIR